MDSKYKESDGWMKCNSKSRPGVFYYFNKKTGQSVWCNGKNANGTSPTKSKTETKDVLSGLKTPAQDRLKRLQSKLQKHKSKEKKTVPENSKKVAPKRKATEQASRETQETKPSAKSTTAPTEAKCSKPTLHEEKGEISRATNAALNQPSTSKNTNGIARKLTDLQKITKKVLDGASKAMSTASSASHKQPFKAKKSKPDKSILKTAAVENAVKELKTQKHTHSKNADDENVTPSKGCKLSIPSYQKGSANSRLEKLRQSLNQQTFTEELFQDSVIEATSMLTKQQECDDLEEAMDWEAIEEDAEANTTNGTDAGDSTNLNATNGANSSNLNITNGTLNSMETPKKPVPNISEFYDSVNENLLRLSAEKDKTNLRGKKKWRPDYYYFVLDTNVLLQYLTFVDELSKMKLCGTKGTMLYIPYVTLQELDGLKMRKTDESVKTRAIRAIKYLNVHLHSGNMKAQSALDERKHLININSADDSIINCCLQAKEHVENVILLSEDANLRNKALTNDILVSTKSDLISIHATSLDKSSSAL